MTVTVQQILNEKSETHDAVLSIAPDIYVLEAIRIMAEKEVGALLILTDNELKGIISERDYTRKVILKNRSSATTQVNEIMTTDVICITPENTLAECMKIMTEHTIRHLPVIEKDVPVAVLSMRDVMKTLLREQESVIDQLQSYITESI